MTRKQKQQYQEPDTLRQLLWETLAGRKFRLDCGHHFTGNSALGNDITIRNGAKGFKIICAQCGY
jgi:hypothetical protein